MTISTNVVWLETEPSQADADAMVTQATTMTNEGKTDGIYTSEKEVPVSGQYTVTRTWTTTADAEEWIAFVLTYNPVSAEIVT